uniref:alpha-mannosidase n=1 Tax=Parascaris univalens TaxID=6257 RepID=A0A915BXT3_PARUN
DIALSSYKAPLFKDERAIVERVEKFISEHYFLDCNLRGRLFGASIPVKLKHYDFGREMVSFKRAVEELSKRGMAVEVGFIFGPTWSTHWFQVDIEIPKGWDKKESVLRLDVGCEALIWGLDGRPIEGLSPDFGRTIINIPSVPSVQRIFVEASANNRNGDGDGDQIRPTKLDKQFRIHLAELREYNTLVNELLIDFELMLEISKFLPKDASRHYEALYIANDMINRLITSDFSFDSQNECHNRAMKFFRQPNAASQMTLYAIGNCHIDTAWLWRYEETKRKCARSWASALSLMENYATMTFAISQAQQLVWLREQYPTLYEDMQDRALDGKLVGVGGSWVEMDGNMPNGESMIRQMLYGQKEFKKMFGNYSNVFWLPDTFGYSAQLPQIMKHCGMCYFVTQKMSWSLINQFPHHSFRWMGIDGTRVLTHFPPHHYVSQITVKECLESVQKFTDRGRSNIAMMLYGHGDGGGGPDESMLKRAQRLMNCDGIPKILHATPDEFFAEVLEKNANNLCEWRGELYLELHNASYTTQSAIKKMNRLIEGLLRDHEFLQAMERIEVGGGRSLSDEWKMLLLNQFHDVLPGTSIKEVVEDAMDIYRRLVDILTVDNGNGLKMISSEKMEKETQSPNKWMVNSCGWSRTFFCNNRLLRLPAFSITPMNELKSLKIALGKQSIATEDDDGFILQNRYLIAKLNKHGQLTNVIVIGSEEDIDGDMKDTFVVISCGELANQFVIFDDVPLYWDAWDVMDYHLETRKPLTKACTSATLVENSVVYARIRFEVKISDDSTLVQFVSLRADLPYITFDTTVEWKESHKFLKVEFPVNINSAEASYDIQYGFVNRPTHRNTSWDAAKYEVCAHKWMALCEYNRGAALLNDCKYGHSCDGNVMRISLLRSSKSPDDTADMGQHKFAYAFYPFVGSMQRPANDTKMSVMRAAFEFNNTIRYVEGWRIERSIAETFTITGSEGVVIDTIKPSEDDVNALIVRLFECFGGGARIRLYLRHARIISVDLADGLERSVANIPIESMSSSDEGPTDSIVLDFRAFEVKTLLIRLFAM